MERISEQLKEIAPRSSEGYFISGYGSPQSRRLRWREAGLNQLIRLAPENPVGYTKLGQLRSTQKRWNEAQVLLSRGAQPSP